MLQQEMKNIASARGGCGLQVVLPQLDSEFNLVLGLGRVAMFEYVVISLEEMKMWAGRDKAWTQQHLESDYKFTLTSASWASSCPNSWSQGSKSLCLPAFRFPDLGIRHHSP